jgi:hypothetical protein
MWIASGLTYGVCVFVVMTYVVVVVGDLGPRSIGIAVLSDYLGAIVPMRFQDPSELELPMPMPAQREAAN